MIQGSLQVAASKCNNNNETSVIVLAVTAGGLQPGGAVLPVPAWRTLAAPGPVKVGPALAVVAAHPRTALQCAVPPIPAGDAETGAVLTLAVLLTPEHQQVSHLTSSGLQSESYLASQSLF